MPLLCVPGGSYRISLSLGSPLGLGGKKNLFSFVRETVFSRELTFGVPAVEGRRAVGSLLLAARPSSGWQCSRVLWPGPMGSLALPLHEGCGFCPSRVPRQGLGR